MEKLGIMTTHRFRPSHNTENENACFWYSVGGQNYMFKYLKNDVYGFNTCINEVLVSCLCKRLGMPCQDARFASFYKFKGVKIKSFLLKGEKEISFNTILNYQTRLKLIDLFGKDYYNLLIVKQLEKQNERKKTLTIKEDDALEQLNFLLDCYLGKDKCDSEVLTIIKSNKDSILKMLALYNRSLNDIDALQMIYAYAQDMDYKVDKFIKYHLYQSLLIDVLLCQNDRHLDNISLILSSDNTLRLAPMYDNGHCLFYMGKGKCIVHKQVQLTEEFYKDIEKNAFYGKMIYDIKNFLTKNGEEFMADFYEKNKKDIISSLPKAIKNKDDYLKTYLNDCLDFMKSRINTIEKHIDKDKDLEL